MKKKIAAFIPARAGSERVKGKNIRVLGDHPLIAYSIVPALKSSAFSRVIVSTDSPEIAAVAERYGAEVPFLRPAELAGSTSRDLEWIHHAFAQLNVDFDAFAIVRPTSPFRNVGTFLRATELFLSRNDFDSIRAVRRCREHPGKMWRVHDDGSMEPFLEQPRNEIPWHGRQYKELPLIHVQDSSLEISWNRNVLEKNSKDGDRIGAFLTEKAEGFSIDYEEEWIVAEHWLKTGVVTSPF